MSAEESARRVYDDFVRHRFTAEARPGETFEEWKFRALPDLFTLMIEEPPTSTRQ